MENEKRIIRTYKAMEKPYRAAKKRSADEGGSLAKMIELFVIAYADGFEVRVIKPKK